MNRLKVIRPVPDPVEPTRPIPGRRLSGTHWWDPDRINHAEDLPRFCPNCSAGLGRGISVEYWESDHRAYHTWCRECGWAGDIVRVRRMIGHEPAD